MRALKRLVAKRRKLDRALDHPRTIRTGRIDFSLLMHLLDTRYEITEILEIALNCIDDEDALRAIEDLALCALEKKEVGA